MEKLIMIPTGHLVPHPDNPRKDIGDVSELKASIEVSGILQNLTVVPAEMPGMYKVIIGHRRLAAAKAAGLEEVPCAVVEMSEEDQLATMLVENMQRSDLTVLEEADGFQMMLDLGKTVAELSKMSGVSETKIRNRVKMTRLDRAGAKEALDRGATLYELAEVEQLQEEDREKVLKAAGTPDFKNALLKAKKERNKKEAIEKARIGIAQWAEEIVETENRDGALCAVLKDADPDGEPIRIQTVKFFWPSLEEETLERPEDAFRTRYFFEITPYGSFQLYKQKSQEEINEQNELKRWEQAERDRIANKEKELKEMQERHSQLREEFAKSFNQFDRMRAQVSEFIAKSIIDQQLNAGRFYINSQERLKEIAEWLGVKENGCELNYLNMLELYAKNPERVAFLMAFWAWNRNIGGYWKRMYGYGKTFFRYNDNQRLDQLYRELSFLGYKMSTEEDQMLKGTCDLLDAEEDDE